MLTNEFANCRKTKKNDGCAENGKMQDPNPSPQAGTRFTYPRGMEG